MVRDGFLLAAAPPWRRGAGMDALCAEKQLRDIDLALGALESWRGRTVTNFREIPLVDSTTAMTALVDNAASASEIHVRSLVRGSGPTASAAGLLVREGSSWRLGVSSDLTRAWR